MITEITKDQINKIYEEVTGFSVMYEDDCKNLSELVRLNTTWFEEWAHEQEAMIWQKLEELGIGAMDADEVAIND